MDGWNGVATHSYSEPMLARPNVQPTTTRSSSVSAVVLSRPFRTVLPSHHVINAFRADITCEEPGLCLRQPFQHDELATIQCSPLYRNDVVEYFARKLGVAEDENRGTEILLELLWEGVRYAGSISLSEYQLAVLLNILYATHQFFLASEWKTAEQTFNFLKETLLLHTVQRPPWSEEVFQPLESQHILEHFTRQYIRHLPLVHMCSLPVHVVHLGWTPEQRAVSEENTPANSSILSKSTTSVHGAQQ